MIILKFHENKNDDFINFWEFLEIPMNSPIGNIKIAFISKFEKIENAINSGESNFSSKELETCIRAYETLSDPYLRFLHNCEIDGEEPPRTPDWDAYFSDDGISDEDLSEDSNQLFLGWLFSKIQKYTKKREEQKQEKKSSSLLDMEIELLTEFIHRISELLVKEQEKQEKKNLQQKNKRTMHR